MQSRRPFFKSFFSVSPRVCSPICFALSKSCNAKEATVSEWFSSKLHDLPKCRILLFLIGDFCSSRKPSKLDKYSASSPSRSSLWLTQISSSPNSSMMASTTAAPAIIISARSGLIAGNFFLFFKGQRAENRSQLFQVFPRQSEAAPVAVFFEKLV